MSGRFESRTKRAILSAFARASGFAAAALLAAGVSLLSPAQVRAEPIAGELNLNASNGYLRLLLRFPRPVDTQVRLSGSILVIGFAEPVDISVDRLNLGATNYIGAARRDPDGRAIRVALSRNVTFNMTNAAEQVFIDLLPESWSGPPPGLPREVVEELARRAREAERVSRVQQQILQNRKTTPVRVRVAKMPTFVRYVFELPDLTGVTTERGKDMLTLVFAAPLRFDLADARLDLPPVVEAIESEIGLEVSRVKFAFKDSVDIRAFREDNNYVVDFTALESKVARPADKDSADKTQTQADAQPPAAETQPAAEPGKPVEGGQAGQENQAAQALQTDPKSESGNAPAAEKQAAAPPATAPAPAPRPGEPKAAPAAPVAPLDSAAAEPSADPQHPVTVQLSRQGDTLRLRFPFAAQTPAAVFQRADMLWLVFDTASRFDVSPLDNESSGTVGGVSVISTGEGQAVRIKLERPRLVGAIADGNAWIITIGDTIAQPSKPLGINRSIVGPSRASITIPIDDPRRLHRIVDPDLRDTLLVVTAPGPARGFLKTQEFVELRTLASTHGIAVEMLADDLSAELSVDKIVLRRPTGLSLSGSSGVARRSDRSRAVLFDTQVWGSDHHANFIDRQRNLIQAAADAPVGKRTRPRLELVRFYLAQGMYVEAKAVLDVIIADDRQTTEDPTALVLRAVANLMFDRPDSALKDLSNPAVGNQQDAQLWRALAYSQQGKWPEAVEGFRTVEGAMGTLPIELQLVALRDAMRVAIEVGDYASAMRRLNDMDSVGVPSEMEPVVAVLQGRLAEGLGRNEDALASYTAAAASPNRPAAAQGHLRELVLRYALGAVKKADIVGELESLTATWRGDETEIEALNYLAQFYTEDARYRDAFNMMRQANVANPNSDMTRKIQDRAAATFNALFLVGKGDTMPAIDALSLFYDFRDLVPIGRRGDEMIRRLADRLVAVDLLDQAAELLQHQVDNRLQGAARAQVATKLALIYLLNHKPEQAQATLRATRTAELSTDMRNQRLLIEARALSDIGRHDLALEIVDNMDSPEAVRLRSDVQWAARRWQRSAEQIELLYGDRWKEFEPLSDVERIDILRAAVGYALGNDAIGISRLKEKYAAKMAEGPDRRAFEVATGGYGTNSAEFRDVVRSIAAVDTLDAFVRDMRKRYPEIGAPLESAQPAQSTPAPGPAPVKTENKGAVTPPA
jgi:tetratricopeptide (TPR) repeat protein